ncbi:MAG: DNA replication and repair protein RecF [Bacteroidales bacterium]|nr:DNA replication and repair protein RecF [Bacteroidales bacterium]
MILRKIVLVNFKNYEQIALDFSDKINCFVGNNGVGKTNLLDAIYYLSMCRSYFNAIDQYNIRNGEEYFLIQGDYYSENGLNEEILCSYKKNSRKIVKRNKKEYDRLSEHIGLIPIVIITPNDSTLITEGSEERRRLIDTIISQYNKIYLEHLIQYNRILTQRNRLLKDIAKNANNSFLSMFEVYDEQLNIIGKYIYEERSKFIEHFRTDFLEVYNQIAGFDEKVSLEYQSQLHEKDLLTLLNENFAKDRLLEHTTVGPHKDDLLLLINNFPAKRIASQGQQKTFLVALKLAEYNLIYKYTGRKPLLLLDDLFDKFDQKRVQKLIEFTNKSHLGQVFITDTELSRISPILKQINNGHHVFQIDSRGIVRLE